MALVFIPLWTGLRIGGRGGSTNKFTAHLVAPFIVDDDFEHLILCFYGNYGRE